MSFTSGVLALPSALALTLALTLALAIALTLAPAHPFPPRARCIDRWLLISQRHGERSCPLCKTDPLAPFQAPFRAPERAPIASPQARQ